MLLWFKNYLTNRSCVVKISNILSENKPLKQGVPQGSLLGPFLFLLYVNKIFKAGNICKMYMYADDLVIISANKSMDSCQIALQKDLNAVNKWSHDNGLVINIKKTKILYVANPYLREADNINIFMHSNECLHKHLEENCLLCSRLEVVDSYEYLGVIFDKNFKFDLHCNKIINVLRYAVKTMYNLKPKLNEKTLKDIYFAFSHSVIKYGILCWGFSNSSSLTKLKKLQLKILKVMKSGNKLKSDNHYFRHFNVLPIEQLAKYNVLLEHFDRIKMIPRVQHSHNTRRILTDPAIIPKIIN